MTEQQRHIRGRLILIDALRGVAIAGVVIFHLVWDLDYAGLISPEVARHPIWLAFGRSLAGTFMVLVGVSLVLAHPAQVNWGCFIKRLLVIALAASAISVVTYLTFPQGFIFFGILHAIVAASLLGAMVLRAPAPIILLIGSAMIFAALSFDAPIFNSRWYAWLGFASQPPFSNDLVPIFPWVGLTLIGISFTKIALRYSMVERIAAHEWKGPVARMLAWLGRHSLPIYLIHQPILLALTLPFAKG